MRDLRLVPLTFASVAKAYPLIQIAYPQVSLGAWQRRAESILSRNWSSSTGSSSIGPSSCGLQTLQDPRGLIVGLFAYQVTETTRHGRTFLVDEFVAVDIIASGQVASRLALEMERLARCCNCFAVHTAVACECHRREGMIQLLSELGHHPEDEHLPEALAVTHLCKPLTLAR